MANQVRNAFNPLEVEVVRGDVVESRHRISIALVDGNGRRLAAFGNTETPIFLRSSAKPFQALPLVESGAADRFGLDPSQLAIMCASHSGSDRHVAVLHALHEQAGLHEDQLQCGTHPPFDQTTAHRLIANGEAPTPLRHNCSGKHSGMLLYALDLETDLEDYLHRSHGVQIAIQKAFGDMVGVAESEVEVAIDGCSAPTFAVPLPAAARGYARLMDPSDLPESRAWACARIVDAMQRHPELVAGEGRFDTLIMQVTQGRLLSKGGAEGYQAIGIPTGQIPGQPALGLVLKVHDGDGNRRARSIATLAVLREFALLSEAELELLGDHDQRGMYNFRAMETGSIRLASESIRRLQTIHDQV